MNLLITGAWTSAKEAIPEIEKLGYSVSFLQQEKDTLPVSYDWVEGIVGNGIFLYHEIEKFTNLRFIQLTSAGLDRVPAEYIREHQIHIQNARGVYSGPMAEFAVAGVLSLYKQMRFFADNQKNHRWQKCRNLLELTGKTVCIVGCGSVGGACAKRFAAFGCRVLGITAHPRRDPDYEHILPMEQLNWILPQCDVLILTLPLTQSTRGLIGRERLALLKKSAVLVNLARGAIIDPSALEDRIDNLGGAVLDVFEQEPLPETSPLWDKKNVIVTPHNSFVGEYNQRRLTGLILENLKSFTEETI